MIGGSALSLEVPVAAMPSGRARIAASVFLPVAVGNAPIVLFAFPGGGYSRGYFDLHFPQFTGYSQASHHQANGVVLVAMDHLGVGQSSTDGNEWIRIEDIADANQAAVDEILRRLRAGTLLAGLPPITPGLLVCSGQSMGGGVSIIMQARHRAFDAIMPLGYSAIHTSLPQRDPQMRDLAKTVFAAFSRDTPNELLSVPATSAEVPDFLYPFFFEDVPPQIVEADVAGGYPLRRDPPFWGSATLPRCVVGMMARGYVAREAAAIDVPVFLGFGERDVSDDPAREPAAFPAAPQVELCVVPNMAHMHNFASTRAHLWDASVRWMQFLRSRSAPG